MSSVIKPDYTDRAVPNLHCENAYQPRVFVARRIPKNGRTSGRASFSRRLAQCRHIRIKVPRTCPMIKRGSSRNSLSTASQKMRALPTRSRRAWKFNQLNSPANDHCNWGERLKRGAVGGSSKSGWWKSSLAAAIVNRSEPCQCLLASNAVAPTKIAGFV